MEQKYTLKNLMDKTIRVYVRDQRIIEGVLTCIDKFGNFLLSNAHEYLYTPGFFLSFNFFICLYLLMNNYDKMIITLRTLIIMLL